MVQKSSKAVGFLILGALIAAGSGIGYFLHKHCRPVNKDSKTEDPIKPETESPIQREPAEAQPA
jgi:hypothetical protein